MWVEGIYDLRLRSASEMCHRYIQMNQEELTKTFMMILN